MELLKRFSQGDVEAFETLFRQHQREVYGYIVRIVRDPGIADYLTVETFWRIYRARSRFDPEAPFGAWARRIATNLAVDHLRHRRQERELIANCPQAWSDSAVEQERRDQIARAFRRLPATLRSAATLALIEDMPYDEIADAMGTPVGTTRVRVFRALRLLRKELNRIGLKL